LKERRQYIHMPELAWSSYLGREFDGQYDAHALQDSVSGVALLHGGRLIQVTDKVLDPVGDPAMFDQKRQHMKRAFSPGFFIADSISGDGIYRLVGD
jgi:hypothetical protein